MPVARCQRPGSVPRLLLCAQEENGPGEKGVEKAVEKAVLKGAALTDVQLDISSKAIDSNAIRDAPGAQVAWLVARRRLHPCVPCDVRGDGGIKRGGDAIWRGGDGTVVPA